MRSESKRVRTKASRLGLILVFSVVLLSLSRLQATPGVGQEAKRETPESLVTWLSGDKTLSAMASRFLYSNLMDERRATSFAASLLKQGSLDRIEVLRFLCERISSQDVLTSHCARKAIFDYFEKNGGLPKELKKIASDSNAPEMNTGDVRGHSFFDSAVQRFLYLVWMDWIEKKEGFAVSYDKELLDGVGNHWETWEKTYWDPRPEGREFGTPGADSGIPNFREFDPEIYLDPKKLARKLVLFLPSVETPFDWVILLDGWTDAGESYVRYESGERHFFDRPGVPYSDYRLVRVTEVLIEDYRKAGWQVDREIVYRLTDAILSRNSITQRRAVAALTVLAQGKSVERFFERIDEEEAKLHPILWPIDRSTIRVIHAKWLKWVQEEFKE